MTDPMNTIETELAKAIVQAAVGGLVELVKKVPTVFRRAGKAKQQIAEAEVERSIAVLATTSGSDQEREVIRQEASWEMLLRGLVAEHRELADHLQALLAELRHGLLAQPRTTQVVDRVDAGQDVVVIDGVGGGLRLGASPTKAPASSPQPTPEASPRPEPADEQSVTNVRAEGAIRVIRAVGGDVEIDS